MDKCPTCGADTRPGDNFCLQCGNRLVVSTSSTQQAQSPMGSIDSEGTLAAEEWAPPASFTPSTTPANPWSNEADQLTVASTSAEPPTVRSESPMPAMSAVMNKIESPARLILRSDNGDVLQEYVLDKEEMSIGRAPNSDILLSKDKLTSRRHATVQYVNGHYSIQDERSANGTFVNSQQLEQVTPRQLADGDKIDIGEHELLFRSVTASAAMPGIESMPTIMVNQSTIGEMTYRTREDEMLTASTSDEFGTRSMNGGSESAPVAPPQESAPEHVASEPEPEPAPTNMAAAQAPEFPVAEIAPPPPGIALNGLADSGITFNRLTNLPQPTLPDVTPLTAALTALDGQVASLQEQLNATQDAMRNHQTEIAQTSNQLRNGVRAVSERMDKTIADVARNREQLAWAELVQLMEDVMNNPRDIEYVTKLARKARELNKVFQIHQNVLNTLAECTSLLRSLIGEER